MTMSGSPTRALTGVARLLIIGASRGIGLESVKAALEAGHSLRALARSARRIPVGHPKLEKMAGDALEMATVKRALTGIDAVVQSFGVSAGPEIILKPTRLFSKATQVLVTAMQEAGWLLGTSGMRSGPCSLGDRERPRFYHSLETSKHEFFVKPIKPSGAAKSCT
jgi:nucleoside-diphosphate-sugar epimerase